jgi:small-conductance mechanosensitive channel
MSELLNVEFLNTKVSDYFVAFIILVLGIVAIRILQGVVLQRLKRWARRTTSAWDDAILQLVERGLIPFLYLGVVYVALGRLPLQPTALGDLIRALLLVTATVISVRLSVTFAERALRIYCRTRDDSASLQKLTSAMVPAIRAAAWSLGVIFILDNLGFNISAVLAGLGIGGVAIALASQGVLADMFSYFTILIDRPFELGDAILIGDLGGTVKHVGIKTTRIQSDRGEEVIIANKDMTSSKIHNFRRMPQRCVEFKIGIAYETPLEQIRAIPTLVRNLIESVEQVRFDRAHFQGYGEYSLNFEVVYFITNGNYGLYMDKRQEINLKLMQEFRQRGIQFAYPTQITYLNAEIDQRNHGAVSRRTDVLPTPAR